MTASKRIALYLRSAAESDKAINSQSDASRSLQARKIVVMN
jgi:hypothetical protein